MKFIIKYYAQSKCDPPKVYVVVLSESAELILQYSQPFLFILTLVERELIRWYLEDYFLLPWGEFLGRASDAQMLIKKKGVELFNAVFVKENLNIQRYLLSNLKENHIRIETNEPEGISIPWEIMRCSEKRGGELAKLAGSFTRSNTKLDIKDAIKDIEIKSFNVLLIISRPTDINEVDYLTVGKVLLQLSNSNPGAFHIDLLRPPTFEQFEKVINEKGNFYHIIHFDGHGVYPSLQGNPILYRTLGIQGKLIFETASQTAQEVSANDIATILKNVTVPVFIINACQSGMTHPVALYPDIASQLLSNKNYCIVCMSYAIYVQGLSYFLPSFYISLRNGIEFGTAATIARRSMYKHSTRLTKYGKRRLQDWLVPVFLQSKSLRLSLVEEFATDQSEKGIMFYAISEFEIDGRLFENNFKGQQQLILRIERTFYSENAILITGTAGSGKTWLCLYFSSWFHTTNRTTGPYIPVFI